MLLTAFVKELIYATICLSIFNALARSMRLVEVTEVKVTPLW